MNGERMPRAAVQHRGERSFKNTVIAKPSINYWKQSCKASYYGNGVPSGVRAFLKKLLPFTAVHALVFHLRFELVLCR